ncbi:MAG: cation-transporting P-type ATPase [bacterium]|nr:cation-transporting P-type ATPase [bacterium]
MHLTELTDPHATSPKELLELLETDDRGLSSDEAASRLEEFGPNKLPEAERPNIFVRVFRHFNDPLIYLLLVAAVVMAVTGHWIDTWVILAVVVVNAVIGLVQEGQAESALEGIKDMLSAEAHVHRDGEWVEVPAEEVVPGDLIRLSSGDRVPADARVLAGTNLGAEEAALTGESVPSNKDPGAVEEDADLGDRTSMVYSGTMITSGRGRAVVTATGEHTEIGKINTMVSEVETLATPLTRAMSRFGRMLTFIILGASAALFVFAWLVHDMPLDELFRAVVAFAVSMIPEGLPAIMTITLARGVQLMAKRNAITRQLNSVETLGSVTVICSDKTGTLTRNEMTVRRLVTTEGAYEVTGTGYAPEGEIEQDGEAVDPEETPGLRTLLEVASRANDANVVGPGEQEEDDDAQDSAEEDEAGEEWQLRGEPTDGGLRTLAMKAGHDPGDEGRKGEIPFDSDHQYMATLDDVDGERIIHLKGAPGTVLDLCETQGTGVDGDEALDREAWEERVDELSAEGMRVLAAAVKSGDGDELTSEDVDGGGFVLVGLYGIIDPPRDEAIQAIAEAQEAGITVKMITGDHRGTALAIGAEMGIGNGEDALIGSEIEGMSDSELQEAVGSTDVFARTSPEHKLRIVEALQERGEVTAMTGDGVNDAPSLKRADVGVAMGIKGTEATKEAADIVLADDNFATIENAIERGRAIYDNLRKSILFILPTNGAEGLVIVVAILAGLTLPLTPLQVLWVNMVVSVTLALALAFEPPEPDVMKRPPRDADAGILGRSGLIRIGFLTVLVGGAALGLFALVYRGGEGDLEVARTLTVNVLVFAQVFYLFNVRFLRESSLRRELFTTNPVSWISVAVLIVLQLVFLYAPFMQELFGSRPLSVVEWGWTLGIGAAVFVAVEVEKLVGRKLADRAE